MALRRDALGLLAALSLGVAIGWLAHRSIAPAPSTASAPSMVPTPSSATSAAAAATPARAPETRSGRAAAPDLQRQRLDAAVWMQQQGILPAIEVMRGNELNPALARLLDLTAGETNRLNAALHDADAQLKALASRHASSQLASDGSQLVVRIPSLPTEGGAIYNDVLRQFADVLGPERQSAFAAIAGWSLEHTFDSFALNPVTYELKLTPSDFAGTDHPIYEIKRSSTDADGSGSGWSDSKLKAEDIAKYHPVLAQFIRSGMLQTTPAPHP